MINIAIFASGNGTNAERIMEFYKNSDYANVKLILTDKENAYVRERAKKFNVPSIYFERKFFNNKCEKHSQNTECDSENNLIKVEYHKFKDNLLNTLDEYDIDFIVLAGFLSLIPRWLIKQYNNRIINIHPALLPKYGGKGMYGDNVHKAVIDAGEKESGITIHYVNDEYDCGNIIFQAKCEVESSDTIESLANKIHKLEYKHYPEVIDSLIKNLK
ncbi:MAG: phosphoribosylglycinamide formyltransferase [Bacteroidales bacterium]|jgi:phosphoribosylglycinamide formyltransferase-1